MKKYIIVLIILIISIVAIHRIYYSNKIKNQEKIKEQNKEVLYSKNLDNFKRANNIVDYDYSLTTKELNRNSFNIFLEGYSIEDITNNKDLDSILFKDYSDNLFIISCKNTNTFQDIKEYKRYNFAVKINKVKNYLLNDIDIDMDDGGDNPSYTKDLGINKIFYGECIDLIESKSY